MESIFSPQNIATDVLTKLCNNTLEPTIDNMKYIWNLVSSLNYGCTELTDEQIDFWISLLPLIRNLFLQSKIHMKLFNIPSIIQVCCISTQIEQICANKQKKIPDLLKILEGIPQETNITASKIINFPIVPIMQYDEVITEMFDIFETFKSIHQFEMPSFDKIVHYSILISIIYCDQLHQPSLSSYEEFKKRTKYIFNFSDDFNCDIDSMPSVEDPFSFVLIRSFFENMNNIHLKRPLKKDTAFSEVMDKINQSTAEKLDQTKFYSTFIYIESKPVPFSMKFCNSDYSSLLFLMISESDFNSSILWRTDEVFHFTPNFLMASKFSKYFSKNTDFDYLINMQMKSLFSVAKYVIEKLEPTPIEILTNQNNEFSLSDRLHALGSLYVENLREDVYPTVFSYWCFEAAKLVSELSTVKLDNDLLNGLLGICRVAATFSKQDKYEPLDSILNRHSEQDGSQVPSTFPSYCYSAPFSSTSLIELFADKKVEEITRYLLLIALLEINKKPPENIEKANADYFAEKLDDPLLFIGLRFLYEKTFNTTVKRKSTKSDFFNEVSQNKSIGDALNSLVFNQGVTKIELTRSIFEERSLYFALTASDAFIENDPMKLCDRLIHNGFQLASHVISNCQTELENLVTRASFGDKDASIELLKHKECLPLLSDSECHMLLKIFLSEEAPTIENIDDPVELSAKLFACKGKKPPATEILLQIIKKCYFNFFFDPTITCSNRDMFLYFSGALKVNGVSVFEKEEDFFNNLTRYDQLSSLSFENTILYYTLLFLKEEEHPELAFYLSDFALSGMISQKVKELLPKGEESRSIYWFLCSCTLSFNRSLDLQNALNVIEAKFARPLYQYLLLCKDTQCMLQMLQHNCCSKAIDTLGLDYLHQSLDLFFATNFQSAINKVTKILIAKDRLYLINYICSHIIEYPEKSLIIFRNFKIKEELAIEFISHLPKLNDCQIPAEMIAFLESILQPLSRSFLHSSKPTALPTTTEKEKAINLTWEEDINTTEEINDDKFIDIWKEKKFTQCEGKNNNIPHAAFCCYTCNMSDSYICTACASTCHKGHRVVYIKKSRFNCSCQNCSRCCFCGNQETNDVDFPSENKGKHIHPPTSNLIDLLLAVSRMKQKDDEGKPVLLHVPITSRLSRPIFTQTNRNYDLKYVISRLSFSEKKDNIVDFRNLNNQYKGHDKKIYKKNTTYIPLNLSTYVNNQLIIAVGKTLFSIDETTYEVRNTLQLNEELISVRPAKVSNDYLVLTSLRSVVIVNSYDLSKIDTIIPKNFNEDNSVIQAEMPIDNKVAIVTRSSLQLFEMNQKEPIEMYNCLEDFITSAVFVNYEDQPFAIIAFNSGRIALQVLGQTRRESGGQRSTRFSRFSSLPSRFVSIFISYSEECDMFFIAAPGVSLQYTRLENVFKYETRQTYQLRGETGTRNEIYFYSTYPNVNSILLFINPCTNSLFAVEFTDDGPEISSINTMKGGTSLSLFNSKFNFYSLIKTQSEILEIANDGSILSLLSSNEKDEDEVDYDEFRPPPTFFTQTEIATTENAEIIGTDTSQNYNTLFHDSVAFFHLSVDPKIMTLILKDPSYSIVGFVLTFGSQSPSHRPSYISVFGRKYKCLHDYSVAVSLKQNEINPGKPLEIEFANTATAEIAMQGIKIFIIKTEKIQPFLQTKVTINYSGSDGFDDDVLKGNLLDFSENLVESKTSVIDSLMYKITTAINSDKDEKNEAQIDSDVLNEQIQSLVHLMYSKEKFADYAKSAILRIIKEEPERKEKVVKIWGNVLKDMMVKKEIEESLWKVAWRDYLLLPGEIKGEIDDVIWESKPKIGSTESIISAFTFM